MSETVIRSMLNALTLDIKEQDSMKHINYNLYIYKERNIHIGKN